MSIDSLFTFRPINPFQDVKDEQTPVFWGTFNSLDVREIITEDYLNRVREEVIRRNLKSEDPTVLTLGALKVDINPPHSQWQIFKAAYQAVYKNKSSALWKEMARFVGFVACGILSVLATFFAKRHLAHRYEQMSRGLLKFYRATDLQRMFPVRKYGKSDFYMECTVIGLGLLFSYTIIATLFFLQLRAQGLFLSTFQRLRQINEDIYYAAQELRKFDSSVGQFDLKNLANQRDGDGWKDPLAQVTLTKQDIRAPRIFLIGQHACQVEHAVTKILVENLENGIISHPVEHRSMTTEERTKFLEDICRFFCISQEQFLDCWNVESMGSSASETYGSDPNEPALKRIRKFFKLIPNETSALDSQKLDSSVGQFDLKNLANQQDGDGWKDSLAQVALTEQDIRESRIFLIGQHACQVGHAVTRILVEDLQNGIISHPVEHRSMTTEEQTKFLEDICRFFCISQEQFLDCWNVESMGSSAFETHGSDPNEPAPLKRIRKFLKLIPNETIALDP